VATWSTVTNLIPTVEPDRVALTVDADAVPRDALYAAACSFTDRCYVRLALTGEGDQGVRVVLRAKNPASFDGAAFAASLTDEVLAQAFRQRLADDARDLTDEITQTAFGKAEAPLDPLAGVDVGTFDDPLGIAQSWEAAAKPEGAQGT
jgi:hypothetical protein